MYILSLLVYFVGYFSLAYSILRFRYVRISYPLGIFVFFTLQFGPHTALIHYFFRLSIYAESNDIHIFYNLIVGVGFFCVSLLFLLFSKGVMNGSSNVSNQIYPVMLKSLQENRKKFILLASFLVGVSVLMQPGLSVTIEHLKYFLGESFFSYKELRREIYAETLWQKYSSVVRYSISSLVYGYFILVAICHPKKLWKCVYYLVALAFVMIVSIQLNKFFFLYFGMLWLLIFFNVKLRVLGYIDIKYVFYKSPKYLAFGALFIYSVILLYKFQYATALSDGILYESDIYNTLVFRIFFASSDALRLWVDYFVLGSDGEKMGLSVVGSICKYVGECFNPNTFIPYYYLNTELTSMQVGFLGTALSMGGGGLVPVIALIFSGMIVFNSWVLTKLQNSRSALFVFVGPVMFINSFFLTTRELHTASLSGGALFTSLVLLVLCRKKLFRSKV